jgi:hypothetical protein
MNVLKFPYNASRRVHSRNPRRSKNGTSEERAAKAAEAAVALSPAANVTTLSGESYIQLRSLLDQEFSDKIDRLDPLERRYLEGYIQGLVDRRPKQ